MLSERYRSLAKKTVGISRALEFVGIMGASVSDRLEYPVKTIGGINSPCMIVYD